MQLVFTRLKNEHLTVTEERMLSVLDREMKKLGKEKKNRESSTISNDTINDQESRAPLLDYCTCIINAESYGNHESKQA